MGVISLRIAFDVFRFTKELNRKAEWILNVDHFAKAERLAGGQALDGYSQIAKVSLGEIQIL